MTIKLKKIFETFIVPKPPFNFDYTVHNPSHFPIEIEKYEEGKFWKAMRFDNKVIGYRLEKLGSVDRPKIKVTLYSNSKLSNELIKRIVEEIRYKFELDKDLTEFYNKVKSDKLLKPVLKRLRGTRRRFVEPLYELIMISILLQNATVRRTVQMAKNLLWKYGAEVEFDGKEMYVIWTPERLAKVSEYELRKLKVGYRAKMFKRISESFAEIDEEKLRRMTKEEAKKELMKLYGIGPASVGILLSEGLHHDVLDVVPPWEQKIYSRLLFNKKLVSIDKILKELDERYGKWKSLAAHYLFLDLFWRHKQKNIDWLANEIRL